MWNGRRSRKPVPGVKFKRTARSYCHKINKVPLDVVLMHQSCLCVQQQNSLSCVVIFVCSSLPPLLNYSKYITEYVIVKMAGKESFCSKFTCMWLSHLLSRLVLGEKKWPWWGGVILAWDSLFVLCTFKYLVVFPVNRLLSAYSTSLICVLLSKT